ncbi:hypothetical protein HK105_209299 [Polyrhizophydium stewartii]|uniref:BZIP domain-containing protein n=1 Tax=Polyrhizophydium stewartii TaxID=2732419 RepID=A0ABR4MVG3_9FUNG|nr:hypothetical protein HK105_003250 [Polyrhizophydium stewartii]
MCFVKAPRGTSAVPLIHLPAQQQQQPAQQQQQQQQQPADFAPALAGLDANMWTDLAGMDSFAGAMADPTLAAASGLASSVSGGLDLAVLDSLSGDNLDVWLDLLSASDLTGSPMIKADAAFLAPLAVTSSGSSESMLSTTSSAASSLPMVPGLTSELSLMPSPPESTRSPRDSFTCSLDDISRPAAAQPQAALPLFPTLKAPMMFTSAAAPMPSAVPTMPSKPASVAAAAASAAAAAAAKAGLPVVDAKDKARPPKRKPEAEQPAMDHDDSPLALKRARNNEAARRSRERKMRRLEELEVQVGALETEKTDLNVRLAVLENERNSWITRERELVHRVLALEAQLSESHRALMQVGMSRTGASGSSVTA